MRVACVHVCMCGMCAWHDTRTWRACMHVWHARMHGVHVWRVCAHTRVHTPCIHARQARMPCHACHAHHAVLHATHPCTHVIGMHAWYACMYMCACMRVHAYTQSATHKGQGMLCTRPRYNHRPQLPWTRSLFQQSWSSNILQSWVDISNI